MKLVNLLVIAAKTVCISELLMSIRVFSSELLESIFFSKKCLSAAGKEHRAEKREKKQIWGKNLEMY